MRKEKGASLYLSIAGIVAVLLVGGGLFLWLRSLSSKAPEMPSVEALPTHVRVAAIQFHSIMGEVERNRAGLANLVHRAADGGAKIVVLPEAAVSGYADIDDNVFWTRDNPPDPGFLYAGDVAEEARGESVQFFAKIAREHKIYLTVPFVEKAGRLFYNTAVLLGPDGETKIHYRKQHLWTVADPSWVEPGDLGTPVIETEYGRIGAMICYDFNELLPEFKKNKADIVLHCVAWYGPWFEPKFNRRVKESGVTLVLANWTFPEKKEWRGPGGTRIIGPDGEEIARVVDDVGDGVVYGDIPCRRPSPTESR